MKFLSVLAFCFSANPVVGWTSDWNERFIQAACENKRDNVRIILAKTPNLDINMIGAAGETALTCAVGRLNYDVVEVLLATKQLDPNAPNSSGSSALDLALRAQGGDDKIASWFIEKFPQLEFSKYGSTPAQFLDLLGEQGRVLSFIALTKSWSLDLNQHDASGATALMKLVKRAPQDPRGRELFTFFEAHPEINLELRDSNGRNLLEIVIDAYAASPSPSLYPVYAAVTWSFFKRDFEVRTLTFWPKIRRADSGLSKVLFLDHKKGVIDRLIYMTDLDWKKQTTLALLPEWQLRCQGLNCEDSDANDGLFLRFEQDEVIVKSQTTGRCLVVELPQLTQRQVEASACETLLAGYSHKSPEAVFEGFAACDAACGRAQMYRCHDSGAQIIKYDYNLMTVIVKPLASGRTVHYVTRLFPFHFSAMASGGGKRFLLDNILLEER